MHLQIGRKTDTAGSVRKNPGFDTGSNLYLKTINLSSGIVFFKENLLKTLRCLESKACLIAALDWALIEPSPYKQADKQAKENFRM